ncbi:MAG: YeeE/YedE thiosulfate transporter family protein [Spirochaetota bacterium]
MAVTYIVTGIVMGLIFGFALEKSRVFEPRMMVGLFQLRHFVVLKVFLTAIATTLVLLAALTAFGVVELGPKAAIYPATVIGGLVFGAGVAIVGACPTTLPAQIGAGYKDAWAAVAGGLIGAISYGYFEPFLSGLNQGPGTITLPESIGLPYWVVALPVAIVIVLFLVRLERRHPWRTDFGETE